MSMKLLNLLEYPRVMTKNKLFWICLLGLWYIQTITPLKITSLDVPKHAWDAVKLNCKYDLEGGSLYAVKWYKDSTEFYRCLANGTVQQFPLKDIYIYHTGSSQIGSCFFELTALTSKSGGEYMCEVSLEWPTFEIVNKTARLEIIEPSSRVQPESATTEDIVTVPLTGSKGSTYLSSTSHIFLILFIICTF